MKSAEGLQRPLWAAAWGARYSGHVRPLKFRLFLLAASGLVPLALVLLVAGFFLTKDRQIDAQRAALELSQALATAVDTELRSTIALLENLALTAQLQDLAPAQLATRFAPQARRVVEKQGWRTIVVADGQGRVVMGGTPVPGVQQSPVEPESMARVIGSRAPAIGEIARGPLGHDAFAVRIPVPAQGQLRYVLSGVVPTDRILGVVARQQLAPSWVVGVYDQAGNRVAPSLASNSKRYSASLEALIRSGGQQGMGITRTLEGVESHTGFSRVSSSGWVVAVGIPAAEASADLYWLLAAVSAGTAASLGLLAWLAWRMARSISGPIDQLKQAAAALGAGGQVALPPLGVEELDEVGRALHNAAIDRDDANLRRTRIEAERELLHARIEEALRVAEQANRNKDDFLALLGHELRNPLAPIVNAVYLMDLKADDRTATERRIIQRQLKYVTRLVDDLLDASRITSRRFEIDLRPLRPVPVLEQTVESLRPMLGERKLDVRIAQEARALWVRADETRLVQVFSNLLGNAIKFTAPTGAIEVRAAGRDGTIELVIRDNGAGMEPADLARAFDLFYQAPNNSRGVSGGLGLGLAIVKSLVDMHSGTVKADSDGPGKGTTVTLTLPLTQPPQQDEPLPQGDGKSATPRVLVVDDNEDVADTLSALLGSSGFEVQVAYTPRSALAIATSFQPDLAILDIGLPEMDGYELARRLRAPELAFGGKLVALTGYGQEKDVSRAMSAGFDAHLTKPVKPQVLLDVIAGLLAREQR